MNAQHVVVPCRLTAELTLGVDFRFFFECAPVRSFGSKAVMGKPPVRLCSHGRAFKHSTCGCQVKKCPKCWWGGKGRKFRAFFPWLRFGLRLNADCFGFGCSACAQYDFLQRSSRTTMAGNRALPTPCRSDDKADNFATFTVGLHRLKSYTLRRHQDSRKHQEAVRFIEGNLTDNDMASAPSYPDFAGILEDMQKGHSMRNGGSCSDRTVLTHFCLSESLFDIWRMKLASCKTLCLIRDERKGKLLIRFRGASANLELCSGTLGLIRMTGGSAEDIVSATARALRIFCTKNFQPPRLGKSLEQRGGFDRALFKHLRSIVHLLTTDSHPAELLASNIMKGNRKSADDQHNRDPFLPNVVLVGRDGAHASTRLVKRPWFCIDVLKDAHQKGCLNDNNIL